MRERSVACVERTTTFPTTMQLLPIAVHVVHQGIALTPWAPYTLENYSFSCMLLLYTLHYGSTILAFTYAMT
jgi:hypothetical protein